MVGPLLAALLAAASPAAPCRAPLPHGPAVPATIVLTSGCGAFRLETGGRVTRLPPRWLARHGGGTGRRYGADLQIRHTRAGRIVLLRRGRLVWRSSGLYPNDGGNVAFGPGLFAFASYRRGVFLTDLKSPERLVMPGRGWYPHDFFRSGRLIVGGGRVITVVSPQGHVERSYAYSVRGSYAFDGDRNTLSLVTPDGRLATVRETRLGVGRRVGRHGMISFARPGVLVFYGARSITVARLDGRVTMRASWPRGRLSVLDSGAVVSGDGRRAAFRLSDARPGAQRGRAILFVLRAGDTTATALYRHRLGRIGCATGATLRWHGRQLLYGSADGQLAVIDTATGRRHDLESLGRALPRRWPADRPMVAWLSDFRGA